MNIRQILFLFFVFINIKSGSCYIIGETNDTTKELKLVPKILGLRVGVGHLNFSLDENLGLNEGTVIGYWSRYNFKGWGNSIGFYGQSSDKLFVRGGIDFFYGTMNTEMKRFYHDSRVVFSTLTGKTEQDTLIFNGYYKVDINIVKIMFGVGHYFFKRKGYVFAGISPSRISNNSEFVITVMPTKFKSSNIRTSPFFLEVGFNIKQFTISTYYQYTMNQFMFFIAYRLPDLNTLLKPNIRAARIKN